MKNNNEGIASEGSAEKKSREYESKKLVYASSEKKKLQIR